MLVKIKKYIAFFLLFFTIGGFVVGAMPVPAKAQWATLDIPTIGGNIWEALKSVYDKMSKQIAATAFKSALSTFLNKLAYDSAVYVAAGGSGQKSLINPFSKEALSNLGDAVAGGFIDELADKTGFTKALGTKSLCEPIDLTTKVNLLMSFKKPAEPELPKCSLTAMKKNAKKMANDNLLELNAGIQIDEGAASLSSSSLNNDQSLAGTTAQMELSSYALELTRIIKDFKYIAELISTPVPDQTPHYQIDNNQEQLLVLEDDLTRLLNQFTDINNRANICYDKYLIYIAVGCPLIPECADFTFAGSACDKAATKANEYSAQLVGIAAKYLNAIQDLNKKIKEGFFSYTRYSDISDITNVFNPEANEMGQFMEIQKALSARQQQELEAAKLKQLAQGPCRGVETPISGMVTTPSSAVCDVLNQSLSKSTKGIETFTGQVVADAFGIFVNTLAAKLMERYFKQGLSVILDRTGVKECKGGKDICGDKTEDLLKGGTNLGGVASAQKAFGGLLTASISSGGQQDILSILAACPPEQPALNNCIIDEPFRRAIEKQLTVKEAMEAYKKTGGSEGLDPKKPFGYILVGTAMDEPDFKNGYPYRSMLYLRKYRIIPVGWELAAQYIKDIEATKQVHTLDNVVDGFDDPTSPFFGLADPAWVLKSPTVFCARQGPGPELISTEIQCEKYNSTSAQCEGDDYQSRKVSRKEWCADEQTCLEEGENGDCKRYGYCTLEKPSWKLGGTQCDKPFASCEGYTNSITKANYALLENTLNKSDCSQSNVGCQWYCQDAPKLCIGGTRGGQPCGTNNDCASIYCSVGTCFGGTSPGSVCSYDTECGTGGACTGGSVCVNGDTPGAACATNAQCGRGVVDGVCEEGGVWSCQAENLLNNGGFEDGSDNLITFSASPGPTFNFWNTWNNSGSLTTVSRDMTTIRSGRYSARINTGGGGDGLVIFPPNNFSDISKGYMFSADVFVESGAAVIAIGNNLTSYKSAISTTTGQWEHLTVLISAQENSTIYQANTVFIYSSGGSATFYVDDVRLYEGDRVNLDRDVKKCEAKDAGCNQFVKVLPGTNLIGNSGFEDDADATLTITGAGNNNLNRWYLNNNNANNLEAEINQTTVHSGKNSLKIEMDPAPLDRTQGLWMSDSTLPHSVVPIGFTLNPEKTYTASAWIYIESADDFDNNNIPDASVTLDIGEASTATWRSIASNQLSPQWERLSVNITPSDFAGMGTYAKEIRIYPQTGPNPIIFYIDDLQLEEGDTTSNYVQYGSSNQAYLNGRRLSCLKEEVGCNLYTPADGGDPIPAVVKIKDQCPAECAGYASFQELPTFFAPSGSLFENLIPKTASSCPASAEGCEEFTNLDTVASGGEAKEYYTKLRQCAKPGTTTEATFYTWEGSEEAGFQLRAWRLKIYAGGSPYATDSPLIPPPDCDLADPDCRTFYDQSGVTHLREISKTVFISDDCHPLRRTIQGTRQDCDNSAGRADPPAGLPIDIVTCFYDAIPSQGLTCQPQFAGCREYRGAAGNNLRVLLDDDFEDLTSQGWTPSFLSNESITVGGRSYVMAASASATKSVSELITQGKTYVLDYWAKSATGIGTTVSAELFGTDPLVTTVLVFPGADPVGSEWNKYSVGPLVFNREPANDETLRLTNGADGLYLDNIVLREITDNPYLIKDSWKTPLSCDLDPTDPNRVVNTIDDADGITALEVGLIILDDSLGFTNGGMVVVDGEAIQYDNNTTLPNLTGLTRGMRGTTPTAHSDNAEVWLLDEGAQLGCKEYTDRLNQKTYLRSFDYLCGEDKVGCTEMFNTYNSRTMYDQTIKGEYIPRDAVEYIVDNPKVYCDASFKGCEKLGQPALGQNGEVSSWGETYLINDPDQYDQIACESNENMCSEFITRGGGTMYFKDPKDALCEYHSSINIEGNIVRGWFKKGIIPAALAGLVFYDSDGDAANDTYAHTECMSALGAWDETKWTYSCPNDQVGCTEYQTPAVSTLQTGNQLVQATDTDAIADNANGRCSNDFTLSCTDSTLCGGNSCEFNFVMDVGSPGIQWDYRFNVLESGQYSLVLMTQNWNGDTGSRFNDFIISVDGIQKVFLDGATAPLAVAASQLTTVNLGILERGTHIISVQWTDVCGAACSLRLNDLVLTKTGSSNYYNLEQGVDTSSCTGVVDPEKGCVAFYDATNPILNIKSSAISGNAFAPAACQKCSLDASTCSTSATCDPAADNCCCTNNAAVTNPCDSNTILKVKADRQCAEWLACTESEKTTDSKGNIIEMCKKRKACRTAGEGVECDLSDTTFEAKQNQTFDNPVAVDVPATHASVVADANLRSGFFKAGAHWSKVCSNNSDLSCQVDSDCGAGNTCDNQITSVVNTIEGYYPYSTFDQGTGFGGMTTNGMLYDDPGTPAIEKIIAFEDDFETYQAGKGLPQCSTDADTLCASSGTTVRKLCLENTAIDCTADSSLCSSVANCVDMCVANKKGTCLNYWENARATNKEFKFGGQSLLVTDATKTPTGTPPANPIISKNIAVNAGNYVLTVWINTKDLEPQNSSLGLPNSLRVEVAGTIRAEQEELRDWTKYISGPFPVAAGTVNISIYMNEDPARIIKAGSKAYVDMISLAPVLEIQTPTGSESYSDRSCRIYAKPDALSCKYRERNTGREIQGWRGFCAEADPKNPEYCLQWWPIDLIEGEDISKF